MFVECVCLVVVYFFYFFFLVFVCLYVCFFLWVGFLLATFDSEKKSVKTCCFLKLKIHSASCETKKRYETWIDLLPRRIYVARRLGQGYRIFLHNELSRKLELPPISFFPSELSLFLILLPPISFFFEWTVFIFDF